MKCRTQRNHVADQNTRRNRLQQLAGSGTLVVVIMSFIGLLAAPYALWGWGLSWIDLAILAVVFILTGLRITIG
jgi:hypothetical protein